MAKRGRPKNGAQPGWMLLRQMLVLYEYNHARAAGGKRQAAIEATVDAIRKARPKMPISETGVRRILADRQPNGVTASLVVTMPEPPKDWVLDGRPVRSFLAFGFGPRPEYPRTNAKPSRIAPKADSDSLLPAPK